MTTGCTKSRYDPDRCPWVSSEFQSAISNSGRIDYRKQVGNRSACIAKWSFALGRANTTVPQIVDAVMAACDEAIDMVADAELQIGVPDDQLTRLPTPDYERTRTYARGQVTFHVVAERAGHCSEKS